MTDSTHSFPACIQEFLDSPQLPDEQRIEQLIRDEPELAKLLIVEQAKRLLALQTNNPSMPSGMIPVFKKPAVKQRKKTPGREKGHPGSRRATPPTIDRRVEHRPECCPDCGGKLRPCHSPNR